MSKIKTKTRTRDKDREKTVRNPEIEMDIHLIDDEWEDEDFGGLKAPDNFKRQIGCGG